MKSKKLLWMLFIALIIISVSMFEYNNEAKSTITSDEMTHPEWSKNANIYEVNIRQYTPAGTFKAFEKHLPRLQKMGVKILWLMPVYPIGEKNRKGELGSYYAVKDYKAVNPNFGTMDDLKALIDDAHERGMKVILDWVANHTAWDHVWTQAHPDWYTRDEHNNFKPPVKDWSDVIDLDYSNQDMRNAMIDALKFWVKEADVDGFRCDVADMVPTDFWNHARNELNEIKPVFMLAESDHTDLQEHAFDMSYDWKLFYLMNEIAAGDSALTTLNKQLEKEHGRYDKNYYRMLFTSNHDENTWNGSAKERLGKDTKPFAVVAATIYGMPLIYGGQEAGLDKRLKFFEKDSISWDQLPLEDFYTKLLNLKTENEAVWNGEFGGDYAKIDTEDPDAVFAYKRFKSDHEVIVAINISDEAKQILLHGQEGTFQNAFSGDNVILDGSPQEIQPHGYLVLQK